MRNVVAGFATAWNHHHMDFVNVTALWWKGRQVIQAQHAYTHGTIPADSPGFSKEDRPYYGIFKTSTLRITQTNVRFLRKDVAVVHAGLELLGDARTPNPRRTVLTLVLTQEDGQWLIAAAQNTEINRTVK